jgi:hypothetical protein
MCVTGMTGQSSGRTTWWAPMNYERGDPEVLGGVPPRCACRPPIGSTLSPGTRLELVAELHVPRGPRVAVGVARLESTSTTEHLGAGHVGCPMIECIPWLHEIFEEPADIRSGVFHVPDTPGASTTFHEERFNEFRVA